MWTKIWGSRTPLGSCRARLLSENQAPQVGVNWWRENCSYLVSRFRHWGPQKLVLHIHASTLEPRSSDDGASTLKCRSSESSAHILMGSWDICIIDLFARYGRVQWQCQISKCFFDRYDRDFLLHKVPRAYSYLTRKSSLKFST